MALEPSQTHIGDVEFVDCLMQAWGERISLTRPVPANFSPSTSDHDNDEPSPHRLAPQTGLLDLQTFFTESAFLLRGDFKAAVDLHDVHVVEEDNPDDPSTIRRTTTTLDFHAPGTAPSIDSDALPWYDTFTAAPAAQNDAPALYDYYCDTDNRERYKAWCTGLVDAIRECRFARLAGTVDLITSPLAVATFSHSDDWDESARDSTDHYTTVELLPSSPEEVADYKARSSSYGERSIKICECSYLYHSERVEHWDADQDDTVPGTGTMVDEWHESSRCDLSSGIYIVNRRPIPADVYVRVMQIRDPSSRTETHGFAEAWNAESAEGYFALPGLPAECYARYTKIGTAEVNECFTVYAPQQNAPDPTQYCAAAAGDEYANLDEPPADRERRSYAFQAYLDILLDFGPYFWRFPATAATFDKDVQIDILPKDTDLT